MSPHVRRTRDDGRYRESSPRRSSHDHRSPSPVRRTRDEDRYRESSPRRSSHDHRSPSPVRRSRHDRYSTGSPRRDNHGLKRSVAFAVSPPSVVRTSPSSAIPHAMHSSVPQYPPGFSTRPTGVVPSSDSFTRSEGSTSRPVSLPRTIAFDGMGSWQAFIAKFRLFADESHWDMSQRKNHLCWALDGEASKYTAMILEREPYITYSVLAEKLEKRFTKRELPEVSQMHFTYARQAPDESIVRWADRLMSLALQAFPDLPESYVQKQVVMRFCQGSSDKDAGQHALNSRPQTIEQAIEEFKWFQHSHRAIFGKSFRKEVKQTSLSDAPYQEQVVCQVNAPPTKPAPVSLDKRVSALESNLDVVLRQLDSINTTVQGLTASFVQLESLQVSVQGLKGSLQDLTEAKKLQASPARARSFSPARGRSNVCYGCGKLGHFRRECPEGSTDKSVSFMCEDEGNGRGSEREAENRS